MKLLALTCMFVMCLDAAPMRDTSFKKLGYTLVEKLLEHTLLMIKDIEKLELTEARPDRKIALALEKEVTGLFTVMRQLNRADPSYAKSWEEFTEGCCEALQSEPFLTFAPYSEYHYAYECIQLELRCFCIIGEEADLLAQCERQQQELGIIIPDLMLSPLLYLVPIEGSTDNPLYRSGQALAHGMIDALQMMVLQKNAIPCFSYSGFEFQLTNAWNSQQSTTQDPIQLIKLFYFGMLDTLHQWSIADFIEAHKIASPELESLIAGCELLLLRSIAGCSATCCTDWVFKNAILNFHENLRSVVVEEELRLKGIKVSGMRMKRFNAIAHERKAMNFLLDKLLKQ